MSLRSFTELLKRTGVQELAGVSLKELTLVFAQSQSEAYDSFEGAVDVEMSYGEFLEALLRLGVRHRAGPTASPVCSFREAGCATRWCR